MKQLKGIQVNFCLTDMNFSEAKFGKDPLN